MERHGRVAKTLMLAATDLAKLEGFADAEYGKTYWRATWADLVRRAIGEYIERIEAGAAARSKAATKANRTRKAARRG